MLFKPLTGNCEEDGGRGAWSYSRKKQSRLGDKGDEKSYRLCEEHQLKQDPVLGFNQCPCDKVALPPPGSKQPQEAIKQLLRGAGAERGWGRRCVLFFFLVEERQRENTQFSVPVLPEHSTFPLP